MKNKILTALCLASCLTSTASWASGSAFRVAPTYQVLLNTPFAGTANEGTGVTTTWERQITDKFSFGINLAYRYYPVGQAMTQIGYGLVMKHYLNVEGVRFEGVRPFLEYGLLLQISSLAGRDGSGTSHDTRLSAGADFPLFGAPLYGAASFHISTLRYFESPSINLNYVNVEFGARFAWN